MGEALTLFEHELRLVDLTGHELMLLDQTQQRMHEKVLYLKLMHLHNN